MPRATNSPASRKRRKKVLKYARGYFGNKSKLYRYAKEAVQHAWQYAYRDRRKKKAKVPLKQRVSLVDIEHVLDTYIVNENATDGPPPAMMVAVTV